MTFRWLFSPRDVPMTKVASDKWLVYYLIAISINDLIKRKNVKSEGMAKFLTKMVDNLISNNYNYD